MTPRNPGKISGIVLSEALTSGIVVENNRGGIVRYDDRRTGGVVDGENARTGGVHEDRLTGGINLNEE